MSEINQIKLFNGLEQDFSEYIEEMLDQSVFLDEDYICRDGDMHDELYIIKKGKVDVLKKGVKVGELSEGDSFGEMSLIEKKERSADVIANGKVELYILNKNILMQIRREEPLIYADIIFNISKDLSRKLRDITYKLQRIWEGYISNTD